MKRKAPQPPSRLKAKQERAPTSGRMSTNCKREKDDDVFVTAFKSSCKLLELKPELFGEEPKLDDSLFISQRSRNKKRIRRLENEITPGAKSAAIKRNRPLKKAALQNIRRHGAPDNISDLMEKLGKEGDRAAREVVRKTFGLRGMPGRKPR
jgi:hypothetical protein